METLTHVLLGSLLVLAIIVVWAVIAGAIVGLMRWARGGFVGPRAEGGADAGRSIPVSPPGWRGRGVRPAGDPPTTRRHSGEPFHG